MLEGSTFTFSLGVLVESLGEEVWGSYINSCGVMDEESGLRSTYMGVTDRGATDAVSTDNMEKDSLVT